MRKRILLSVLNVLLMITMGLPFMAKGETRTADTVMRAKWFHELAWTFQDNDGG